jgi:hypothetical protein
VADQLVGSDGKGGYFPSFVYVLLPDDHTRGGVDPTPEAMIADNDAATGLLIDRLSHSDAWASTAVFVLEDDPQDGRDHVDAHRSYCVVASPWAKAGHVSRVLTSFPAVFRTIELILGIGPTNRFDAFATPMWDAFTSVPTMTPYVGLPSALPWTTEQRSRRPSRALSEQIDFSGPDRSPILGDLLWWDRKGTPPEGSALARYVAGDTHALDGLLSDDDDAEIYATSYRQLRRWLAAHPEVHFNWKVPGDDDADRR